MARKWRVLLNRLDAFLTKQVRKLFRIQAFGLFLLVLCLAIATPALTQVVAAQNPEHTAQQLYEVGRYREAVDTLQQVLNTRKQAGDRVAQAIVLSNLSLGYQKLGDWDAAAQAIEEALRLLDNSQQAGAVRAQVLDVRASLEFERGHAQQAAKIWQQAAALYDTLKSARASLSRIRQAQALQQLGLNRQAIDLLSSLETQLRQQPDSLLKATTLRTLGDTLRVAGKFKEAEQFMQQSLEIAQRLKSPDAAAVAQLSLGNIAQSQGDLSFNQGDRKAARTDLKAAFASYQAVATDSVPVLLRAQARLNALNLLIDLPKNLVLGFDQWSEAKAIYDQLLASIDQLPKGRSGVEIRVGMGRSAVRWQRSHPIDAPDATASAKILAAAIQEARELNDPRSLSNAMGYLGRMYEQAKQWSDAQSLTQQALIQAQSIDAGDLAYRWQWQLGRILRNQGQTPAAIATYTEAFNTLQSLRRDLVAVSTDVQFSFRESVEPLYRELVDLLLQTDTQENLLKAREVLESLQVAELQNFLQSACQDRNLEIDTIVDRKDPTAAVIYPVMLSDRLELLLKLPGQPLYHAPALRRTREEVESQIKAFQRSLQESYRFKEARENSQTLYSWLVELLQKQLDQSGIKTLLFVLDGSLRNVPMAALYDGKQYLVERYAIALELGLEVQEPAPMNRPTLQVLAASLTDAPPNFEQYDKLENVNKELDKIERSGVKTRLLRDAAFTRDGFKQELTTNNFQVIHLATHGQFGTDRTNTFILAADGKIQVDELDQLFRTQRERRTNPLNLLILSACQTATGNDRAVLGIAGTAVRAGAQSAIAGLWTLADEPSVLFTQTLYQYLGQPQVSRAEALRRAQVALLNDENYSHPRYWAPYVLVGSWL